MNANIFTLPALQNEEADEASRQFDDIVERLVFQMMDELVRVAGREDAEMMLETVDEMLGERRASRERVERDIERMEAHRKVVTDRLAELEQA